MRKEGIQTMLVWHLYTILVADIVAGHGCFIKILYCFGNSLNIA